MIDERSTVRRTARRGPFLTVARARKRIAMYINGHSNITHRAQKERQGRPEQTPRVTGSEDKTARLWDTWTGETKHILLSCHVYAVLSVTFSADWAFIVSRSMDKFVGIWDTATRGLLYKLGRSSIASKVTSVAVSRASTLIAAGIGGTKCTVNLWDVATSELQRTIKGHSSPVYAVAFSHNSKFLALGSYDDTAVIWDTATWEILHKLEGHPGGIYSVAFSHDDRLLAFSCGHNGCIRLCHVITGG